MNKASAHLRRAALACALLLFATDLFAAGTLPTGGVVSAGTATMSTQGNVLTVTNSSGAVINWQDFSVGSGATANFVQPSASSVVLNRVVGASPSTIAGTLQSNGRVFLTNPNGAIFTNTSQENTAAFTVTTNPISNAEFPARATGASGSGSIVSLERGTIHGDWSVMPSAVTFNTVVGGQGVNLTVSTSPNGTITLNNPGTTTTGTGVITLNGDNSTLHVVAGPSITINPTTVLLGGNVSLQSGAGSLTSGAIRVSNSAPTAQVSLTASGPAAPGHLQTLTTAARTTPSATITLQKREPAF